MEENYDVIIIGSGIGGLVCGCYLAKQGMKVLITEQHSIPGGYCTSFKRQGFKFDVGICYFGGIKEGTLGKIIDELGIRKKLKLAQFDPVDKIITPGAQVFIRANPHDTIKEFTREFPREKRNIEGFFKFIMQKSFIDIYSKVKNLTYKELIDSFFSDKKIKFAMSAISLANTGLESHQINAVFAIILFRVYILDPGYYTQGGIQGLPNALVDFLKKRGGKLLLSNKAVKVLTSKSGVQGIICSDKKIIKSRVVISNADATQLFGKLLNCKTKELEVVKRLKPSISAFGVYLGLDIDLSKKLKKPCNILYFSKKTNKLNNILSESLFINKDNGIICEFPSLHDAGVDRKDKSAMSIFIQTPCKTKIFWDNNRERLCDWLIDSVEKDILKFPLRKNIKVKFTATPYTLQRYTSNYKGALFGWASTLDQINSSILPPATSIKGLYLTGHWSTLGFGQGGITGVALSGRKTAEVVLRDKKKEWPYGLIKP